MDAANRTPRRRTGHCACVSNGVMFVFGGKDVRPGMDSVAHNDLYGYDLKEREWLPIEDQVAQTRGRRRVRDDVDERRPVRLSPSDTMMEMVLWCLQLSAQGRLRWTQVSRGLGSYRRRGPLRRRALRRQLDRPRRPRPAPGRRPRGHVRLSLSHRGVGQVRPRVGHGPEVRTRGLSRRRSPRVAPRSKGRVLARGGG